MDFGVPMYWCPNMKSVKRVHSLLAFKSFEAELKNYIPRFKKPNSYTIIQVERPEPLKDTEKCGLSVLNESIRCAFNDSIDGSLSSQDKVSLAQALHLSEKDVVRKFRNRRNYLDKKAQQMLIELSVVSTDSPLIDHVSKDLKLNRRRVEECLLKNHKHICTAIEENKKVLPTRTAQTT